MSSQRLRVFDTTLRDGEQSPGCSMNLHEKLTLARQLERLGVDVIEAGFPIASDGDFDSVRAISKELSETIICGLARTGNLDVERAGQAVESAKKPRIHVFIATSDIHLEHKLRMSREQVLEEVDRAVRLARTYVDDVEFSAEDATRSDRDYLVQVFDAAIAAGASTLNVPDTVGYTTPKEYGALIDYLSGRVTGAEDAIFSIHCHDDLGLAVANSLSAIRAGARQVECTINGIGERAGNTSLEEVVMALSVRSDEFGGLKTGITTQEIYPTSRLLSSITGVQVQPNKAIVGDNAFAHEAGIHQDGVLKAAITYEIMTPESIGRASNELVLGKHSGRHAFSDRLIELGLKVEGEDFERAFRRFKSLADAKKVIYNEDLEAIVSDSVHTIEDRFSFESLTLTCGSGRAPNALVRLGLDGVSLEQAATGVGPVDAIFRAISELLKTSSELIQYQVHAVTAGLDAQGEVSVTIEEDGRRVIGNGVHEDVMVASAKAYVNALNKLEWHKKRRDVDAPRGI
ncbi:MAG TPA: 2-isopropylmalate synthase [Myxococcales bacterium]|nr:2-isopropylmalate synthase [Myxococcales bacterium]HIK84869.1 2-isopropylmalate synthase [Myxococcales bacterium]